MRFYLISDNVDTQVGMRRLLQLCPEMIYDLKLKAKRPLIVEIPDRHGNGRTKDSITRYVREAIGIKI